MSVEWHHMRVRLYCVPGPIPLPVVGDHVLAELPNKSYVWVQIVKPATLTEWEDGSADA